MSDDLYEKLRAAIIANRFSADERLTETSLGATFGVSRTPVREALGRLEQDGLVERTASGTRVRSRSTEEILQIYEVRIVLESLAGRHAAEKRGDLDLVRLGQAHEHMQGLTLKDDPADLAHANQRFHRLIWDAGRNATLSDMLIRLHDRVARYPATTLVYPGRWAEAIGEHGEILEAISGRDMDGAERLIHAHMTRARDIRLRISAGEVTS